MNSFALIRCLLVLLFIGKELLYYAWIFPSWWAAHSQAYEDVLSACARKPTGSARTVNVPVPAGKVQCEIFSRMLHPMGAVRTIMVYEVALKVGLIFLARAVSTYWLRAYAYKNRLRWIELLMGAWIMVSAFAWRLILRAHEEVRARVPGLQLPPVAAYFQKWISPWIDLIYILFLWIVFAVDLFPA